MVRFTQTRSVVSEHYTVGREWQLRLGGETVAIIKFLSVPSTTECWKFSHRNLMAKNVRIPAKSE